MKTNQLIAAAVAAAVAPLGTASAQQLAQQLAQRTPQQLEPVIVTADPLERGELDSLRPVSVVRGDELRNKESTNLGATLSKELGVQSSAYGPGAGRPIIRGMDSSRVRVTESGLGVADVSGASPDHRVAADTLNARQVEILRGPATLLYGSGAVGGLVNIVSDRVPRERATQFGAGLNLRGSTAERERAAALDLDGPLGNSASWRLEGFKQRTSDYELAKPLRDENGDVIASDRLPNSDTDTQSIAAGGAWFGAQQGTRLGGAVQRYESDYGIPNTEEPVTIKLRRTRYEFNGDLGEAAMKGYGPFTGLRTKFSVTDYKHTEFEPTGEAGATFTNRGGEGRIELPHGPQAFIPGFSGVLGVQALGMRTRGSGEGELPKTEQQALALFAVQERLFGDAKAGGFKTEFGARVEREALRVKENYEDGSRAANRNFNLLTVSGGATWLFVPGWDAGASLTFAQRAPAVEELYFVGAHPATFAYEIGDPNLRKEKSFNLDLSLRKTAGVVRGKANVFYNRVRDYIYGAFDGSTTDIVEGGVVVETLSNLFYRQADAQLYGAEAEVRYGEREGPQARVWGDLVRGKLTSGVNDGGNLPRMSPARIGIDAGWRMTDWSAQLSVTRVQKQSRTSSFDLRDGEAESATSGYTLVDLGGAYRVRAGSVPLTFSLQGKNLTNEDIRIHTSFLKNQAPPPGRSVWFGVRAAL